MTEGINYIPEGLGQIISSPFAKKRLKNREGVAIASKDGQELWRIEGPILEINENVIQNRMSDPDPEIKITISENSCGSVNY